MIKLAIHNKHWNDNFFYDFEKKRELFDKLVSMIDKKQIISITGLRRTGKTILMKQLINHLIAEVKRNNILYFSFDEEKPKISELMQEYISVSGADIEKEKLYIFLDEVQKLENWQEQIKVYYDNYLNIKFFVSGSESLFIRKRSDESLAGRIFNLELPILSFKEYLIFKGKENLLKNAELFKEEIKSEMLIYLRRNFIDMINEDESTAKIYVESIINKIVYEDIPSLFSIDNPEKLKSLVQSIYMHPGMLVEYNNLANDLSLNFRTIKKYLFYLSQAKIIKKIYNFSTNFLTSERKLKRFYVAAPCFCFLNDNYDEAMIAENIVALSTEIRFFYRDPQKNEVDFIAEKNRKPYPIEVKYKERIDKKDIKPLLRFMNKFNIEEGMIITKEHEANEAIKGKSIRFVPLWKWLIEPRT